MAPLSPVLFIDVEYRVQTVLPVEVGDVREGADDGIEVVEDVDPGTVETVVGEPGLGVPLRLELVGDLPAGQRTADGDESVDRRTLGDALQCVVGDDGSHAVAHHHVGSGEP